MRTCRGIALLPHVSIRNIYGMICACRSLPKSKLICRPSGNFALLSVDRDCSLNIGLIATKIRGTPEITGELLRIPFGTFYSWHRATVMRNPRLNRFSGALRVHLRYVSSHVGDQFDPIDRIHYEWLRLRAYPI